MSAIPIGRPIKRRESAKDRAQKRAATNSMVTTSVVFLCIAGCAYLVSSMAGQVMVEKARREGILATLRAQEAMKAESMLRRHVESLTSLSSIDDWAKSHGFIAPDQQVKADVQPATKPAGATVSKGAKRGAKKR